MGGEAQGNKGCQYQRAKGTVMVGLQYKVTVAMNREMCTGVWQRSA